MSLSAPKPLRILLADNDGAAMQTIASALRRRGHQVQVTDCIEAASNTDAEVLVCDLPLALQALECLRQRGVATRAIVLAERPTSDDCRQVAALGALEVLAKPFRLGELVRAIETPAAPLPQRTYSAAGALLERSYRAMPGAAVQAARDVSAVALRCGVGPATRARIGSAIAEIVENACTHGYAGGEGTIELAARFERADLLITIRDAGCGFDATLNNTDPTAETRGIARARALAEEIGIESTPGVGTRVELVFRTSHVGFDENGAVDLSDHDFFTPELARRVLEALELDPRGQVFELSPALAVVVGRLLSAQVGMPDRNAEVRR
jgi:anti-sigma regulatory factor (Ser/Thr protein kinase)